MRRVCAVLFAVAGIAACSASSSLPDFEHTASTSEAIQLSALKPLTQVYVQNAGALDVETQYLPQVVCCENGAAPPEALAAQAVMARTYMYFRNAADGLGTQAKPFSGTQSDQAYHCAVQISNACKDAVSKTNGQITAYTNAKGTLIANVSFFIDGPKPSCLSAKSCACAKPGPTVSMSPTDHPAACACFDDATQGVANPAYVTYNWSQTGANVAGSTIGDPANESNRGCASQNIQACLAYAGWSYFDQLRFFYGQDIELRHADGSEVTMPGSSSSSGGPTSTGAVTDGGTDNYLGTSGHLKDGDAPGCSTFGGSAASRAASPAAWALAFGAAALGLARRRRRG